jgi:hypothetical protein
LPARIGFPAAKRYPGAGARQLLRDRFADAPRRTGNQGDFSAQVK